MNMRVFITLAVITFFLPGSSSAQEPAKRAEWDQKKAVERIKQLITLEEKGELPWDKIAWKTDPAEAAALAQKEQKPIFVFFFLKKDVGPANAPC
jgi:hypothetical protein